MNFKGSIQTKLCTLTTTKCNCT